VASEANPPVTPAPTTGNPPDTKISATDIEKAAEKGLSYEHYGPSNDKILIGQRIISPKFYLIPTTSVPTADGPPVPQADMKTAIADELWTDPHLGVLQGERGKPITAVDIFLKAVQDGFTIEDDVVKPVQGGGPCPINSQDAPQNPVTARLVLRSLIGVMAAVAQEQKPLGTIIGSNSLVTGLVEESLGLGFKQAIPEIELLPILRINWKPDGEGPLVSPSKATTTTKLEYRDIDYMIADSDTGEAPLKVPENEYWNRDVFRLIAALTAQVTVDTSKYPIANILQLNSVQ